MVVTTTTPGTWVLTLIAAAQGSKACKSTRCNTVGISPSSTSCVAQLSPLVPIHSSQSTSTDHRRWVRPLCRVREHYRRRFGTRVVASQTRQGQPRRAVLSQAGEEGGWAVGVCV